MRVLLQTSWLLLASILLTACSNSAIQEKKYYWLGQNMTATTGASKSIRVAVTVPYYLRQPAMVLALSGNQLAQANYHLWAEPLHLGLESNLAYALEAGDSRVTSLSLIVKKLHGNDRGQVVLDASWQASLACKRQISGRFYDRVEQAQSGYSSLVDSHQVLLDRLAKSIVADALASCS